MLGRRCSPRAARSGAHVYALKQVDTREAGFARYSQFEILEEFSDLGVSGAKELSDRPGLAALLDRLESSAVRTVIVERADRLARELIVQEVIVGQFVKIGARILTADGVDLTSDDDPTRRLIRQVLVPLLNSRRTYWC